jgi:hypothetical protein
MQHTERYSDHIVRCLTSKTAAAYHPVHKILCQMKSTRLSRVVAALIALCSMLFMQLAVAGYVCPQFDATDGHGSTIVVEDVAHTGTDCLGADKEQANLCQAEATFGNQSVDNGAGLSVPPFAAAAVMLVVRELTTEPAYVERNVPALLMARVTAPPASIRNCCFRI